MRFRRGMRDPMQSLTKLTLDISGRVSQLLTSKPAVTSATRGDESEFYVALYAKDDEDARSRFASEIPFIAERFSSFSDVIDMPLPGPLQKSSAAEKVTDHETGISFVVERSMADAKGFCRYVLKAAGRPAITPYTEQPHANLHCN